MAIPEYQPTRPQVTNNVDAARNQANSVDVNASAQDVDTQLAAAKTMQEANKQTAAAAIDYNKAQIDLAATAAQAIDVVKAKNDGLNATVDPTRQKLYGELSQNYVEQAKLNDEEEKAGWNIFKRIEIGMKRSSLESSAVADAKSLNRLTDIKNMATQEVNAEVAAVKTHYVTQQQMLGYEQAGRIASAKAAYENAEIASKTASYVAKTEMGVASNIYERGRQGVADARAALGMELDQRRLSLQEKELKAREAQIDAEHNDVVTKYLLTNRGLEDNSQNRTLVQQWADSRGADEKRSIYDSAARWAVTMEHADPTLNTPQEISKEVTRRQGTVADVQLLLQQTGDDDTMLAYTPRDVDVQTKFEELSAQYLANKAPETSMGADGVAVTKAPTLNSTDMKVIQQQVADHFRTAPAASQFEANKESVSRNMQVEFAKRPDQFIQPGWLQSTIATAVKQPEVLGELNERQMRALGSISTQDVIRGLPTVNTGAAGDGVLNIADKLVTTWKAESDMTGKAPLSDMEAYDLVAKLFKKTTTDQFFDPAVGGADAAMLRSLKANDVTFDMPYMIAPKSTGKTVGFLERHLNPMAAAYTDLEPIDVTSGESLKRGVQKRRNASKEASAPKSGMAGVAAGAPNPQQVGDYLIGSVPFVGKTLIGEK